MITKLQRLFLYDAIGISYYVLEIPYLIISGKNQALNEVID
jgi:hypothetical protein